jgi:hypothetical protein
MSSENLVHVKLEYEEALEGKRDILYVESDLLKGIKAIKNYGEIRFEEQELKMALSKKIKNLLISMKSLKTLLPKPNIPGKLKEEKTVVGKKAREKKKEIIKEDNLEEQLREINEKLKAMS